MNKIALFFGLLICLFAAHAVAHSNSAAYLYLTPEQEDHSIALRWDIAVKDLAMLIKLDRNNDAKITWGEIQAQEKAIKSQAVRSLHISAGTSTCRLLSSPALELATYGDRAYISLQLESQCLSTDKPVMVHYRWLFDINPNHRALLSYTGGEDDSPVVLLSKSQSVFNLTDHAANVNTGALISRFLYAGIHHFLIGYDHLLFLLTLLLPAVMVRQSGTWQPTRSFSQSLRQVLLLVTAFTIAHSITLSISALGIIQPSVRWIEALIALSIILSAIHNIHPLFKGPHWQLAFGVGLIHGFGFANVLQDGGLAGSQLILPLAAFNLGVEIGQALIILLLFPLFFSLRRALLFRPVLLQGGSITASLFASLWFVQRIAFY